MKIRPAILLFIAFGPTDGHGQTNRGVFAISLRMCPRCSRLNS